jgi:hypothetical protein
MQILVTRTKTFSNGGHFLTVGPAARAQEVPDWIRKSNTFLFGAKDGSVQEIEVKSALAPAPEPEDEPELEPAAKGGKASKPAPAPEPAAKGK